MCSIIQIASRCMYSHSDICRIRYYSILTQTKGSMSKFRQDILDIHQSGIKSILPSNMMAAALKRENNRLIIGERSYILNNNVYIAAFGKAVLGMLHSLEELLHDHVLHGIASVPIGLKTAMHKENHLTELRNSKVKVLEAAKFNIPDESAYQNAIEIEKLALSLGEKDILICLISGGGSALLPYPMKPLTIDDLIHVTQILSKCGATIYQVNALRRNLEKLKGGGLARAASPAKVISLIVSDVVGNSLEDIASGPTYPATYTSNQCIDIIRALKVEDDMPDSVKKYFQDGWTERQLSRQLDMQPTLREAGDVTLNPNSLGFQCNNVFNVIIGSNLMMVNSAEKRAVELGYLPFVLSTELDGEAREVGIMLAKLSSYVVHSMKDHKNHADSKALAKKELDMIAQGIEKETIKKLGRLAERAENSGMPICIIASGETTVKVVGKGSGGRNQELALSAAIELDRLGRQRELACTEIEILSAGSDGQDGPTDAAGAIAHLNSLKLCNEENLIPQEFLADNNSYNFFSRINNGVDLLKTGLTGVNCMDLQLILIKTI